MARRYLRSGKRKSAIQWVTRISVTGITVTTAALIILLSAFNGIEEMVKRLYSDFDPDITIRSAQNKTIFEREIDTGRLKNINHILNIYPAVEEIVVLKHEDEWTNASLIGIPDSFLTAISLTEHMVDGFPFLREKDRELGIIGASLLDRLGGFIPTSGYETIVLFAPKRNLSMRFGSSPFNQQVLALSGRMNYNREVNAEKLLVPLQLAQDLYGYQDEVSAFYVDTEGEEYNEKVKVDLEKALGEGFVVRTSYQKNELIYQTSKTEKRIVILILLFIFIISAFTLIAALTMMYVEKKDNLRTLRAMGAGDQFTFRLFFIQGLLIAGKGIVLGFILGYGICFAQLYFSFLQMPNTNGEAFPLRVNFSDGAFIFLTVSILSLISSYFPARFLMRNERKVTLKTY